jgi:hypothetical protein
MDQLRRDPDRLARSGDGALHHRVDMQIPGDRRHLLPAPGVSWNSGDWALKAAEVCLF